MNEWIDLIFGYKQKGKHAIEAHNIFYYLTYEGTIDLKSITDPLQKEAVKAQIEEYGQTPKQLFKKPHPKRNLPETNEISTNLNHKAPEEYNIVTKSPRRILYIKSTQQKLVFIYENGTVALSKFSETVDGNLPFKLEFDKTIGTNKEKQINISLRKDNYVSNLSGNSSSPSISNNTPNVSKNAPLKNPSSPSSFEKPKSSYSNLFAFCPNIQNLISCGNWETFFVCKYFFHFF